MCYVTAFHLGDVNISSLGGLYKNDRKECGERLWADCPSISSSCEHDNNASSFITQGKYLDWQPTS
jgi:hypothetical protein